MFSLRRRKYEGGWILCYRSIKKNIVIQKLVFIIIYEQKNKFNYKKCLNKR